MSLPSKPKATQYAVELLLKNHRRRLTDEELLKQIQKEFPGTRMYGPDSGPRNLGWVRTKINRGEQSGVAKPKKGQEILRFWKDEKERRVSKRPTTRSKKASMVHHDQLYGEPIDFRGLRHAPINEQGVVFLFGMICRELGYSVEAIQQGFPDCEAKYLCDQKKNLWAKASIEFEYKASSFQTHGHDPDNCDVIVCWINDWPNCPLEVIELKNAISELKTI